MAIFNSYVSLPEGTHIVFECNHSIILDQVLLSVSQMLRGSGIFGPTFSGKRNLNVGKHIRSIYMERLGIQILQIHMHMQYVCNM